MQQDFSLIITDVSDRNQTELTPQMIHDIFIKEYMNIVEPYSLKTIR